MRWAEVSCESSPENASVASLKAAAHSASSSIAAAAAVESVRGDSVERAWTRSGRVVVQRRLCAGRARPLTARARVAIARTVRQGVTKGQKTLKSRRISTDALALACSECPSFFSLITSGIIKILANHSKALRMFACALLQDAAPAQNNSWTLPHRCDSSWCCNQSPCMRHN